MVCVGRRPQPGGSFRNRPRRSPARPAGLCPRRLLALLLAAALFAALAAPGPAVAAASPKELPEKYRTWLEEVELIITKEETAAFLALEKDYQRDAFIERFWRVRDTYPDTARNEFRDRWTDRVQQARARFDSLKEDRARILLLNGPPAAVVTVRCSQMWPAEVWYYAGSERVGEEFALLFYQRWGQGGWRIWRPLDGVDSLFQFSRPGVTLDAVVDEIRLGCPGRQADALIAALSTAVGQGVIGFDSFLTRLESAPDGPSGEWVATFNSYSTDLPDSAERFAAEISFAYPGRRQSRTVVQGLLAVPVAEAAAAELAGHRSYNFLLTGEVLQEDQLFDSFRYRFNLPAADVGGDSIPLVFERYLRPGDYRLVLKLEDVNGARFFRLERPLAVPRAEAEIVREPADPETARLLAEANAALSRGEASLQLIPPQGELQTGMVRFDTLATGEEIAEVRFELDGKAVLTKNRPPYSVELDLGSLPRTRELAAIAHDAAGEELARDELVLNSGGRRFEVRLVEPRPGKRYEASLRAQAEVQLPEGSAVERVEFYRNETLVATLFQPPFVQPIVLPGEETTYVRAVAYQPDGNSTEDVVFVNAPDYLEELDVQFVELYVAALDRAQRPRPGLDEDDFRIFEDAVEQQPVRFERVENLPVHVGILLDVSASMEEELETARAAALRFFQDIVTPKDRAALITFNDHPNLAVKFTSEIASVAGGLAGLKAERGTALYDSVIFGLYYFSGVTGQRALLLLTDGKDESSKFSYEDTLEFARRAGVSVYTIGLDLSWRDQDIRRKLNRLAGETGGRSFFITGIEELAGIYEAIEKELRSRYYLAYQSSNTSTDDTFRTVRVEVSEPGVEAKTLRGYYP